MAALVDLLHSYEHAAPLVAELCCLVPERPTNRLAVELLREVGRLDAGAAAAVQGVAVGDFCEPCVVEPDSSEMSEEEVEYCSKVLLGQHKVISEANAKVAAIEGALSALKQNGI